MVFIIIFIQGILNLAKTRLLEPATSYFLVRNIANGSYIWW
jgi:hypothetical protein